MDNKQTSEDQKKSSGTEEVEETEEKDKNTNAENNNAGATSGDAQKNEEETNNYDYEQNKRDILEKIEIRKQQADLVEKYIYETGIGTSFQIIFSELISKKIPVENYYTYTASRLRQIGREKENLDRKKK